MAKAKTFLYNGEYKTILELSEITGLLRTTIDDRLRQGLSIEEAINKPIIKLKFDTSKTRYGKLMLMGLDPLCGYNMFCWCECGNICVVKTSDLKSGHTKSCGCYKNEVLAITRKRRNEHGLSKSITYTSWASMKSRCLNKEHWNYFLYGGNGIIIHETWLGKYGFNNFYKDMGPRPDRKHTIHRKDSYGNYEPSNCVWATSKTQGRQKKNTKRYKVGKYNFCLAEWSEITGFHMSTLSCRIRVRKWSPKKAFSEPLRNGIDTVPRTPKEYLKQFNKEREYLLEEKQV